MAAHDKPMRHSRDKRSTARIQVCMTKFVRAMSEMLTMVIGIYLQDPELVAQVFQLHRDVGAVFLGEEHGEFCLDLGLLIK